MQGGGIQNGGNEELPETQVKVQQTDLDDILDDEDDPSIANEGEKNALTLSKVFGRTTWEFDRKLMFRAMEVLLSLAFFATFVVYYVRFPTLGFGRNYGTRDEPVQEKLWSLWLFVFLVWSSRLISNFLVWIVVKLCEHYMDQKQILVFEFYAISLHSNVIVFLMTLIWLISIASCFPLSQDETWFGILLTVVAVVMTTAGCALLARGIGRKIMLSVRVQGNSGLIKDTVFQELVLYGLYADGTGEDARITQIYTSENPTVSAHYVEENELDWFLLRKRKNAEFLAQLIYRRLKTLFLQENPEFAQFDYDSLSNTNQNTETTDFVRAIMGRIPRQAKNDGNGFSIISRRGGRKRALSSDQGKLIDCAPELKKSTSSPKTLGDNLKSSPRPGIHDKDLRLELFTDPRERNPTLEGLDLAGMPQTPRAKPTQPESSTITNLLIDTPFLNRRRPSDLQLEYQHGLHHYSHATSSGSSPLRRSLKIPKEVVLGVLRSGIASGKLPQLHSDDLERAWMFLLGGPNDKTMVKKNNIRKACVTFLERRKNARKTLADKRGAIQRLEIAIFFSLTFLLVITIVVFATSGASSSFLSLTSTILAFGFIFGQAAGEAFQSVLFIFLQQPFDVGDTVAIGPEESNHVVEEINLLSTKFLRWDGVHIQLVNYKLLKSLEFRNVSRSPRRVKHYTMYLDLSCFTKAFMDELSSEIEKFLSTRKDLFTGEYICRITEIIAPLRGLLRIGIQYQMNDSDGRRWMAEGLFLINLCEIFQTKFSKQLRVSAVHRGRVTLENPSSSTNDEVVHLEENTTPDLQGCRSPRSRPSASVAVSPHLSLGQTQSPRTKSSSVATPRQQSTNTLLDRILDRGEEEHEVPHKMNPNSRLHTGGGAGEG